MSDTPRFDLIDIAQALQRRLRFILIVAAIAAICAAIAYLIAPKKYKASAAFFVSNPLYTDRNNIFRNDKTAFVDYYGREDDVDKVLAVAKADGTHDSIIFACRLWERFALDTMKDKKWKQKAEQRFDKSFEVKRTEYQTVEASYTDTGAAQAADLCNQSVAVINRIYSGYYNALRTANRRTLQSQLSYTDSLIASLTDSLAAMRDRYSIYDVISPARMGPAVMSGGARGPGYGRAMEEIQSLEATKDQLVMDRMRTVSLIGEFGTGMHAGDQPQIQVISPAIAPTKPKGLGLVLTALAAAAFAGFFAALWVLFTTYFRKLTTVQR